MTRRMNATAPKRSVLPTEIYSVLLAIVEAISLIYLASCTVSPPSNSQEMPSGHQAMVHHMGHEVMPFDLNKTQHIFEMTDSGGIQQVVTKAPNDTSQVSLIQQHLQHEAMRFSKGDYSDPASLHGAQMPGLKELAAGEAKVKVEYSALPNGAQILFTTQDIHLITAIHRWFGAQLADHGADATYR